MTFFNRLVLLSFMFPALAQAHEGVTYTLIFDKVVETLPESKVSIVADPDLGGGTLTYFFKGSVNLDSLVIDVISSPLKEGLPVLATLAQLDSQANTFVAKIPFSQLGAWTVRTVVKQNNHVVADWEDVLEVVSEGPSRKEFILYTIPFLLVGFVLTKVYLTRKNF